MSLSLARRPGAVRALVAAAGAILVAAASPVLAAAPVDPGPSGVQGGGQGSGVASAPGRQAEPAAVPQESAPAAAAPVIGPPTGLQQRPQKRPPRGRDTQAAAPTPAGPATAVDRPAAAAPVTPATPAKAKGPDRQQGQGRSADRPGPAERGVRGPLAGRSAVPVAGLPVTGPPTLVAVVGPVVPAAAPAAPVMGPHVPRTVVTPALAPAGSRAGRTQVAAAGPAPLRPGAEPIPRPVDLGASLPSVAVQTVTAAARTPQWPLGIAGVVLVFLLLQNRIDRRDPKLGQARLESEAALEFTPLPAAATRRPVVAT